MHILHSHFSVLFAKNWIKKQSRKVRVSLTAVELTYVLHNFYKLDKCIFFYLIKYHIQTNINNIYNSSVSLLHDDNMTMFSYQLTWENWQKNSHKTRGVSAHVTRD